MSAAGFDALVLDVGNVLVRIDFSRALEYWAAHSGRAPEDLHRRFHFDDAYERHERGELSTAAYFQSLRVTLDVDLDDERFETGWNAIFVDEVPGIRGVLDEARARWPVYAFSNTNHAHYRAWWQRFESLFTGFQSVFLSCDIGARKPDRAAFDHIVRTMGVDHGRVLFIDDTEENVAGARAAGLQAAMARSAHDVRSAIDQHAA